MITISEKAATKIVQLLESERKPLEQYHVRVSVISGGCSGLSYKMDFDNNIESSDHIFQDKGLKIAVDKKSFFYLLGTQLDYSDGLEGKGFNFVNPNASRTCACGESFSL